MWKNHPEMARRWAKHTPKGKKLPKKVASMAVPAHPVSPHEFPIHIRIKVPDGAAWEALVTQLQKLHGIQYHLARISKKEADFSTRMPDRAGPKKDDPTHSHDYYVSFLKDVITEAGCTPFGVRDSTVMNSATASAKMGEAAVGPVSPAAPDPSLAQAAKVRAYKRAMRDPASKQHAGKLVLVDRQRTGQQLPGMTHVAASMITGVACDFEGEGPLTKKELARRIAEQVSIPATRVHPVVQKVFDHIALELMNGKRVELRNFGVFEMRMSKGKKTVMPDGRTFYRGQKWHVYFKPSRRIHSARPGFPGKYPDEQPEEAPFSLSLDLLVAMGADSTQGREPNVIEPMSMRSRVQHKFSDERRARSYASALLAAVPSAKVKTDGARVSVDFEDQHGPAVHGLASAHFKLSQRALKRRLMRRRKVVDAAVAAAKMADPGDQDDTRREYEPDESPAPPVGEDPLRTPPTEATPQRPGSQVSKTNDPSDQPIMRRSDVTKAHLYFEGDDLAGEAARWLSQNGVKVRYRDGDHEMHVKGARGTVNKAVRRFKGSPIPATLSFAGQRGVACAEGDTSNKIIVHATFENKRAKKEAMLWMHTKAIRHDSLAGSNVKIFTTDKEFDNKIHPELSSAKYGIGQRFSKEVSSYPGGEGPRPGAPSQEATEKYKTLKTVGAKFMQYVVDFGSIVASQKAAQALKNRGIDVDVEGGVLSAGLKAVLTDVIDSVIKSLHGKVLQRKSSSSGSAPSPSPWVNHPTSPTAPTRGPIAPPVKVTSPKVSKVSKSRYRTQRAKHGDPNSPGFSLGIGSAVASGILKMFFSVAKPLTSQTLAIVKRAGAKVMSSKVVVTPSGVAKTVLAVQGTRQSIKDVRRLMNEDPAASLSAKKSKAMGTDTVAIAYAVMDFISSEATRAVTDYLVSQGIRLVKHTGKRVIAKIKDSDQLEKAKAVVKKYSGRLKIRNSKQRDADMTHGAQAGAEAAVPLAIPIIVYAIEGIAALLTAAVAVKQLQAEGVQATEVNGKVIAKAKTKADQAKIEKVARKAKGRAKKIGTVKQAASLGYKLALSPEEQAREKAARVAGHEKMIDKYRQKIKEARSKGDHLAANNYADRLQQHQDALDTFHGRGPKQSKAKQPEWTAQDKAKYRRQYQQHEQNRRWEEHFNSQARAARRFNNAITAIAVASVAVPLLIDAGVYVYQKGKQWFADRRDAAKVKQVEEQAKMKSKGKKKQAASMGWKTNVWTAINVGLGAAQGATSGGARGNAGAAVGAIIAGGVAGVSAYIMARGVESIFDPRTQTINVPEEESAKVVKMLQDQGLKVKVRGNRTNPKAASMSAKRGRAFVPERDEAGSASMGPAEELKMIGAMVAPMVVTFAISYGIARLLTWQAKRKVTRDLASKGYKILKWTDMGIVVETEKPINKADVKDEIDQMKATFNAAGMTVTVQKAALKKKAASFSMSNENKRLIAALKAQHQRSLMRGDIAMSQQSEDMGGGCTKFIQVFGEDVAKCIRLAKEAGLEPKLYDEGRLAITGPRKKVELFVADWLPKVMGKLEQDGTDLKLSHDLDDLLKRLRPGSKARHRVELAYQDMNSMDHVSSQRKARYRAMANSIAMSLE